MQWHNQVDLLQCHQQVDHPLSHCQVDDLQSNHLLIICNSSTNVNIHSAITKLIIHNYHLAIICSAVTNLIIRVETSTLKKKEIFIQVGTTGFPPGLLDDVRTSHYFW